MLAIFKKKSRLTLGVDIGSTSVKLVELGLVDGRYQLECYGIEPLPAGAVVENNIIDVAVVGETVKRAWMRSGSTLKDAAVAVDGSALITKIIEVHAGLSDTDMQCQVSVEAEQYISYPIDELAFDFEVLGPGAVGSEMVTVLLVACRSEQIQRREDVCAIANLNCKAVDIQAYTMQRAFELVAEQLSNESSRQLVAIVDVGATLTTLSILDNNNVIYTREQLFGGQQLTAAVQRCYGLSEEDAERAKKKGRLPDEYKLEVLQPFIDSLLQAVMRSLQLFYASSDHSTVDCIVMAGGTANLLGLHPQLSEHTDIPVVLANPFAAMSVSPRVNATLLSRDAHSLMIACGLAMRGCH